MKTLLLDESIRHAKKHGLPFVKSISVKNEAQLLKAKIKYPVAMKAVSPRILHKTEFKAVRLGIKSREEAVKVFKELKKLPGTKSVLMQEMIKGTELIVGIKKDAVFGQTILVGFGGVYTELLKDFSLRICPVDKKEAGEMLEELKLYRLLTGFRGREKANLNKVTDFIVKTSRMAMKNENITEADFNPVIAGRKNTMAVDARIVVE